MVGGLDFESFIVYAIIVLLGAFGKVYKGYLNQTYIARMSIRAHSKAALIKQQKDDNVLTVAIKTIKSESLYIVQYCTIQIDF